MGVNKILVAIPAWNEERSIASVIDKVRAHRPDADVLVVSDGSTDRTAAVAEAAGANVAVLPFNVGVGGAMRTAFLYAERNGYQALVQVDADGQHEPAELDTLVDGLQDADIVVGTRFHERSTYGVWGPRKWAMKMLSVAVSKLAHSRISDPTSGFRSAGPKAIALFAVQYPAEYLGDTVGSLAIASRHGLRIAEAPVTMYFREYGRPSKNVLWATLYLGRASLALLVTALQQAGNVEGSDGE
jgi:glycosyltransferase involved in cell wall biosynthesis